MIFNFLGLIAAGPISMLAEFNSVIFIGAGAFLFVFGLYLYYTDFLTEDGIIEDDDEYDDYDNYDDYGDDDYYDDYGSRGRGYIGNNFPQNNNYRPANNNGPVYDQRYINNRPPARNSGDPQFIDMRQSHKRPDNFQFVNLRKPDRGPSIPFMDDDPYNSQGGRIDTSFYPEDRYPQDDYQDDRSPHFYNVYDDDNDYY